MQFAELFGFPLGWLAYINWFKETKMNKTKTLLATTMTAMLISLPFAVPSQAQSQTQAQVQATQKTVQIVQKPVVATTSVDVRLKGYIFGLRVMKANVSGTLTDDNYALRADLYTSGLGAVLKKFQIWATTNGRITETGLRPTQHIQQNMDKKHRRVEMNYGKDAVDISIVPPLGSQGTPPATLKQRFESDDTLSALLDMMMRGYRFTDEPCSGTVPVFDSKQHYLLRMERAGTRKIKQRGYKGDTIICKVYYVPVSGFDPEDLPSQEEATTPVVIYLAKFDDPGLYIPVRMTYKISFFKAVIKTREINIRKN